MKRLIDKYLKENAYGTSFVKRADDLKRKKSMQTKDISIKNETPIEYSVWPVVPGWDDEYDVAGKDTWENTSHLYYQHYNTGSIVDFDAKLNKKSDKFNGTWDTEIYGNTLKGKFETFDDIPVILKKIANDIPKIKAQAIKKLPKNVSGWKFESADGAVIEYTKEFTSHIIGSLTIWDVDDFFNGESAEIEISVDDQSGYQSYNTFRKTFVSKNGLKGFKSAISTAEKQIKKKL